MKFTAKMLCFVLLFTAIPLTAQTSESKIDTLSAKISRYFAEARENIHLHLDKTVFLSSEKIWFKGYIFDKNNHKPFWTTTNVFVVLMDSKGKEIHKKLLYANGGTFGGYFKLDEKMESGVYYLQVFTNWMNNFAEDESSVYKISVINSQTPLFADPAALDYSKVNIEFFPEGGHLLDGVSNNVGIRISDCNLKPIAAKEISILDQKGNTLKTVMINRYGVGRFDFEPDGEAYRAVLNLNGKIFEAALPKPELENIALEINNFAFADKTLVRIKTRPKNLAYFSKAPLMLLIRQNGNTNVVELQLDTQKPVTEIFISNDLLFDGVNVLDILGPNESPLAERMIFKQAKNIFTTDFLQVNKNAFGIVSLNGKLPYANANLSISVLPEESISLNDQDLYSDLLLNPYLDQKIENAAYYLNEPSRSKNYELDLQLLTQRAPRYKWQQILSGAPKMTFEFDQGLKLMGKIDPPVKNPSDYKLKIYSVFAQMNELTDVDEKNEFLFDNILLADSLKVQYSLLKIPKFQSVDFKFSTKILNGNRTFNKKFTAGISACPLTLTNPFKDDYPRFKNVIYLEEVGVEKTNKNQLKRQNGFANMNLRGYKITDKENNNQSVLTFIGSHGFFVSYNGLDVIISGKMTTSFNSGKTTPLVYLDDVRLIDFGELGTMMMDDLDEIYLNAHTIVPSVNNNEGIIRMYRKKLEPYKSDSKTSNLQIVKNGFDRIVPFVNAEYTRTDDAGFEHFGLINWIPVVFPDQDGNFKFDIPDYHQKTVRILIEGFTTDGKIISEVKTISVN